MLYIDTSAFMKRFVAEEHSADLRKLLDDAEPGILWSSELLGVEAHRAGRQLGVDLADVDHALSAVTLVTVAPSTFEAAKGVGQDNLRSLDALHLAAALELGGEVDAMVVYDKRLAIACSIEGVPVLSPGLPDEWWIDGSSVTP